MTSVTIDDLNEMRELLELGNDSLIKQKIVFLKGINPDADQAAIDSVNIKTVFILPERFKEVASYFDYVHTSKLIDNMVMIDSPVASITDRFSLDYALRLKL